MAAGTAGLKPGGYKGNNGADLSYKDVNGRENYGLDGGRGAAIPSKL